MGDGMIVLNDHLHRDLLLYLRMLAKQNIEALTALVELADVIVAHGNSEVISRTEKILSKAVIPPVKMPAHLKKEILEGD
jgi:hypothetical protein